MIERKLNIEVKSLLRQFPAVAILGARQVGKTTMAKEIAAVQKKPPLYLDLENRTLVLFYLCSAMSIS